MTLCFINVNLELDHHSFDIQGTKTRIRSCHPAEHGGKPCPEKNEKNLQLYEEKMDCSRVDCESRPVMLAVAVEDDDDDQHDEEVDVFVQKCFIQVTVQPDGLAGLPAPPPADW